MDYRDWTSVLFTDESKFCLYFTDRRQLVLRMSKKRFDESKVTEHDRYGKGSVMVWAGISVNGKLTCTLLKTEHWRIAISFSITFWVHMRV